MKNVKHVFILTHTVHRTECVEDEFWLHVISVTLREYFSANESRSVHQSCQTNRNKENETVGWERALTKDTRRSHTPFTCILRPTLNFFTKF